MPNKITYIHTINYVSSLSISTLTSLILLLNFYAHDQGKIIPFQSITQSMQMKFPITKTVIQFPPYFGFNLISTVTTLIFFFNSYAYDDQVKVIPFEFIIQSIPYEFSHNHTSNYGSSLFQFQCNVSLQPLSLILFCIRIGSHQNNSI